MMRLKYHTKMLREIADVIDEALDSMARLEEAEKGEREKEAESEAYAEGFDDRGKLYRKAQAERMGSAKDDYRLDLEPFKASIRAGNGVAVQAACDDLSALIEEIERHRGEIFELRREVFTHSNSASNLATALGVIEAKAEKVLEMSASDPARWYMLGKWADEFKRIAKEALDRPLPNSEKEGAGKGSLATVEEFVGEAEIRRYKVGFSDWAGVLIEADEGLRKGEDISEGSGIRLHGTRQHLAAIRNIAARVLGRDAKEEGSHER